MNSNDESKFKIQTLPITLASAIVSVLNGIIGYIAVYFFKPLWEKIVSKWNNKS